MLDEAHERTLYTDIAIGLLKKVSSLVPLMKPSQSYSTSSESDVSSSPLDSEKAARSEADCGICHAGCQGDWLIKMNLMICYTEKKRVNKDNLREGSDHSVPVLMKDHEGMNVACRLKRCLGCLLIATQCSFDGTKVNN